MVSVVDVVLVVVVEVVVVEVDVVDVDVVVVDVDVVEVDVVLVVVVEVVYSLLASIPNTPAAGMTPQQQPTCLASRCSIQTLLSMEQMSNR